MGNHWEEGKSGSDTKSVRTDGNPHLLKSHPYDLSGGEQQRAALAKVLLLNPEVLLLDEPTKGMDSFYKRKLAKIFRNLLNEGKTIIMVSHDIEFCAEYADICALFFNGSVVTSKPSRQFFVGTASIQLL